MPQEATEEAPFVEREAKLMETGAYPDKGVTISEEDLERLTASFAEPVPVYVEHRESPVRLGWLKQVWRRGQELFGRLALLPEAEALLQRLGVRSLSLALTHNLSRIVEVSVTGSPRIASAQMFSRAAVCFDIALQEVSDLECQEPVEISLHNSEPQPHESSTRERQLHQRVQELERTLKMRDTKAAVERWLRMGKLTPAVVPFAEAILMQSETKIAFNEDEIALGDLFHRFVDALPASVQFGEMASVPEMTQNPFTPEELSFLNQHFPDLEIRDVVEFR